MRRCQSILYNFILAFSNCSLFLFCFLWAFLSQWENDETTGNFLQISWRIVEECALIVHTHFITLFVLFFPTLAVIFSSSFGNASPPVCEFFFVFFWADRYSKCITDPQDRHGHLCTIPVLVYKKLLLVKAEWIHTPRLARMNVLRDALFVQVSSAVELMTANN